ncbi:MAG: hypothetical protein JST21_04160 [Bacteroidetes bacterium]|nr:hypothetical protein [Bacteroidota bacterium]
MLSRSIFIFMLAVLFSCKTKDTTPGELTNDLKTAIQASLYKSAKNDSGNVKYVVEDVNYFEESDKYICEFKVHVQTKLRDTTGLMKAEVSKDLKTIKWLY